MEESDKIVVLTNFDLAIEASLAKTKLDAHGIPCFLKNEDSIYPIPINPILGGVQLMVFEADKSTALEILSSEG